MSYQQHHQRAMMQHHHHHHHTQSTATAVSNNNNFNSPRTKSELIVDTMVGMKELAVESVSGFKEWAAATASNNNKHDETLEDFVIRNRQEHGDDDDDVLPVEPKSPDAAVRSLYGDSNNYESVSMSKGKQNKNNNKGMVHEFMTPFLACSSGLSTISCKTKMKKKSTTSSAGVARAVPNQQHPRPQGMSDDDWMPNHHDGHYHRSELTMASSIDSRLEDEMYQIQRLTSWNTMATEGTYGTHVTYETIVTEGSMDAAVMMQNKMMPVDDDGNAIPQALVEKVAAATNNRKKKKKQQPKRRKRVVQFEYPPVRSVKEYERVDPEDMNKLFFTEEELDQYEDDRDNTRMADDVEIVAVASSTSLPTTTSSASTSSSDIVPDPPAAATAEAAAATMEQQYGQDDPDGDVDRNCTNLAKLVCTPKVLRPKQLEEPLPPPPPVTKSSSESSDQGLHNARRERNTGDAASREAPPPPSLVDDAPPPLADSLRNKKNKKNAKNNNKKSRLIKGVQIYMRERSTAA